MSNKTKPEVTKPANTPETPAVDSTLNNVAAETSSENSSAESEANIAISKLTEERDNLLNMLSEVQQKRENEAKQALSDLQTRDEYISLLQDEIASLKKNAVEATAATVVEANENSFTAADGKKYRVKHPRVKIPGIGERTALEVCADAAAQEWLLNNSCVGSVLEEIL